MPAFPQSSRRNDRADCSRCERLLRQRDGAFDAEGLAGAGGGGARLTRGGGVGLASTDPEDEVAFGDDGGAGLGDDAEVARVESELDFLRGAGVEMDALESAERD